jgi:hypothetical protein
MINQTISNCRVVEKVVGGIGLIYKAQGAGSIASWRLSFS